MPTPEADQKKLKEFIERRHPLYEELAQHWDFLEETYEGGRAWFSKHIHKYVKEGDEEYTQRVKRAYRFNHTREVVDLVDKYLHKMDIHRNKDNAPESVKRFWKNATLSGLPIAEFAKRISNRASVFGRPWIVVDSTKTDEVVTRADEKEADARCYAYLVPPRHVLDMSYDEHGKLNWVLLFEVSRDDKDPINSSGNLEERYRLWTRDNSQLFRVERKGNKKIIVIDAPIVHGLGVVPVIPADHVISDELYASPSMVADVAYLDRAAANYLSNIDAIIQDQTFSQLIMPAQGVLPGEESYDKLLEMGTKRLFTYDGESGMKPEYISPDVKQAQMILQIINKIINEIYHSVGLAGERTKEDNAQGIDNSSGVAKAYDFERVNSLLIAKGDAMEGTENKLAWLVAKWHGEEKEIDKLEKPLVSYPDNYDVRGLYDEFEIAGKLVLIEAPDEVRREQMSNLIEKLFPQLKEDLKRKMLEALKSWPPKITPADVGIPNGAQSSSILKKAGDNVAANKLAKA